MPDSTTEQQPDIPGIPGDAPEIVKAAAQSQPNRVEDLANNGAERGGLDFLLGASAAMKYDVRVELDTPDGPKPLTFHFRAQDPRVLARIDSEHRQGNGPFAQFDSFGYAAEVCSTAVLWIEDATGKRTAPQSDEFRGQAPSPALAMELRFKTQGGILDSVAEEIRRMSGYDPSKVGSATRSLVKVGKP